MPPGLHQNFGSSGAKSRQKGNIPVEGQMARSVEAVAGGFGAVGERPIDLVHLARMTLGDRSLEREVLQLFVRQASMLLRRMQGAESATVATLAHTLKGSAQGLGAWRVADAAAALESRARGQPEVLPADVAALQSAVEEAQEVVADLLRAH
jgi:HPt (histidine-containing phosphotransfer) domain-containing protein